MIDSTFKSTLLALTDALVVFTKQAGVSETEFHQAVSESYARVEVDMPSAEPGSTISLDHRNLFGHILSVWHNDAVYLDEKGNPLALPKDASSGPSFTALFQEGLSAKPPTTGSIDAATALDVLCTHESIRCEEDGRYLPVSTSFYVNRIPGVGLLASLAYVAEYAATMAVNARPDDETRFVRVARTQNFPARNLPSINAMLLEEGLQFLQEVDAFIERESADRTEDDELRDVGIGLYFLNEPSLKPDDEEGV